MHAMGGCMLRGTVKVVAAQGSCAAELQTRAIARRWQAALALNA